MSEKLTHMDIKTGRFYSGPDRQRLYLEFVDRTGKVFEYTPFWGDIVRMIEAAATTENINGKPQEWLTQWADLTQHVARQADAAISNSYKFEGDFTDIDQHGHLLIRTRLGYDPADPDVPAGAWHYGRKPVEGCRAAFGVTEAWARPRLGKYCEAFVVSGLVVDVEPVEVPEWCNDHPEFGRGSPVW